ncbi:hypothetical protein GGD66_006998 [Bradyrhizobium sp. CIR48]|nr:hypothetical protein [Bradyrhizobium sp. CIR48]
MKRCIRRRGSGGRPGKASGGKTKVANLASFVADTCGKTGTAERSIRRDATRANALGPDLDRIAGNVAWQRR